MEIGLNGGAGVREAVSVVVMARLIDRQGHIVGPEAIDSIEYSVYRIDEPGIGGNHAEMMCDGEPVCVADVIFPEPRREPSWDADGARFNFRHCFTIPNRGTSRFVDGGRYDVHYLITQITGETTIVRFRIRMTRND